MANKVISFQSSNQSNIDKTKDKFTTETFLDISMTSSKKNNKFKIEKSVDIVAIENSLRNLFTWIPGERVLNPDFPTDIRKYLFDGLTKLTKDEIVAKIKSTIMKYEPRVILDNVYYQDSVEDDEDHTCKFTIVWHTPYLNNQSYTLEIS